MIDQVRLGCLSRRHKYLIVSKLPHQRNPQLVSFQWHSAAENNWKWNISRLHSEENICCAKRIFSSSLSSRVRRTLIPMASLELLIEGFNHEWIKIIFASKTVNSDIAYAQPFSWQPSNVNLSRFFSLLDTFEDFSSYNLKFNESSNCDRRNIENISCFLLRCHRTRPERSPNAETQYQ